MMLRTFGGQRRILGRISHENFHNNHSEIRFSLPRLSYFTKVSFSTFGNQTHEQSIQEKYKSKLEQKLKEVGVKDLEELKSLSEDKLKNEKSKQRKAYEELIRAAREKNRVKDQSLSTNTKSTPSNSPKLSSGSSSYSSPIKPLDSIVDLSKFINESPDTIKKLWTAYHLSSSNPNRMGAVIPSETYKEMIKVAKKYPSFVIPLNKSEQKSSDTKEAEVPTPMEMIYLQWDLFCPPPNPPSILDSTPRRTPTESPTIAMFTPLVEYKLHQSFARPNLILTHYTELIDSHGIVLMRGDITSSSEGKKGQLSSTEAQLLVLRLQQFYCSSQSFNQASSNSSINKTRYTLLKNFHENPSQFQLSELIDLVKDI